VTDCTCPEPGWCERHKVNKTPHWHHLCQTRENYFQAWEQGRGPGQRKISDRPPRAKPEPRPPRPAGGPGTELKKILSWFGLHDTKGCKCKDRALRMDAWGPDLCLERIDTIVKWLGEEAKRRGVPFSATAGRVLVRWAIRKARRISSA
jgi:hypothetical protein